MTPNDGLLEVLRCPSSGGALRVVTDPKGGVIALKSESDGKCYPVKGGIPRFVPESNYADNFGMQWKLFSHTQLDSRSGIRLSQDRFEHATKWTADRLAGRLVLDAGCGAGRFAEIALQAGAHVIALDYSTAVDACLANLRAHPRLLVVQGDIYSLPFGPGSFDFIYSLGVLQHTPDVRRAFMSLPRMLKPGGEICVDYYERWWGSALLPKYWLRPLTKRMRRDRLFRFLEAATPALLGVSDLVGRVPLAGKVLRRAIPVANYRGVHPLDEQQLREWALLDTFDWLSPAFDNPQSAETAKRWMVEAGLESVTVEKAGHLVARGRRPAPCTGA